MQSRNDGGYNGLVDVDELVAALTGDASAGASKRANIKFQTWTVIGAQNKWADNFAKEDSAGVGVKSYWKFGGNITPHVPVYVEVALFENESFDNLYSKDNTDVGKNALNLLVDTVFDPVYYFGGQKEAATYLGHFKSGIETPWLNWTTGYKYAKLPPHTNVNWDTVDKEWEAGYNSVGGYNQFATGAGFKSWLMGITDGAVDAELVFAPNRSADRAGNQYGIYAYADATILGNHYVDFQYNGAYGSTFDTIFNDILEDDFIFGYRGGFGPVTVKANYLLNLYGSRPNDDGTKSYYKPSTSDVGNVKESPDNWIDNMAANVNVTFRNGIFTAVAGGRFRGNQASMMYVEDGADDHTNLKDQLGKTNRLRAWFDVNVNVLEDVLSLGLNPYYEQYLNPNVAPNNTGYRWNDTANKEIYIKPYFSLNLGEIFDVNATFDGYGEMRLHTSERDMITSAKNAPSAFVVDEIGLRYSQSFDDFIFQGLAVTYCYDGNDEDCALHSLIAEVSGLPFGLNAQCGVGFRTANGFNPYTYGDNINGAFGAFVGANKQISAKYNAMLYCQFLYGMDPYNAFGDDQSTFKLDDYSIDRDASDFAGASALRMGVRLDF